MLKKLFGSLTLTVFMATTAPFVTNKALADIPQNCMSICGGFNFGVDVPKFGTKKATIASIETSCKTAGMCSWNSDTLWCSPADDCINCAAYYKWNTQCCEFGATCPMSGK